MVKVPRVALRAHLINLSPIILKVLTRSYPFTPSATGAALTGCAKSVARDELKMSQLL